MTLPVIGLLVSIAMLLLAVAGLGVKIVMFMSKMSNEITELRKERRIVQKVPVLEYRVGRLEQDVGIEPIAVTFANGEHRED